ncbi:MAG: hypothetical protein E7037_07425 [Verrucomicrobia bacterium]|nr:hypothetical protein [Verrucomicrobiota bacterium]
MKLRYLISAWALTFFLPAFAFGKAEPCCPDCKPKPPIAERPEDAGQLPPPPMISGEDARLLKSLFLMSNAELVRLREFIRRLEQMPPEQRKRMATDLERAAAAKTPEQRRAFAKEMRERFRKERANLLSRYYAELTPEQADAERKKFLAMNPKERRAYIREIRKKMCGDTVPAKEP